MSKSKKVSVRFWLNRSWSSVRSTWQVLVSGKKVPNLLLVRDKSRRGTFSGLRNGKPVERGVVCVVSSGKTVFRGSRRAAKRYVKNTLVAV